MDLCGGSNEGIGAVPWDGPEIHCAPLAFRTHLPPRGRLGEFFPRSAQSTRFAAKCPDAPAAFLPQGVRFHNAIL